MPQLDVQKIALALSPKAFICNGNWITKCPIHGDKKASMSIRLRDDDRLMICCHAGCDFKDILEELKARGLLQASERRTPFHLNEKSFNPKPPERIKKLAEAKRLWSRSIPIADTAGETYLLRRGIALNEAEPNLRFCSDTWNSEKQVRMPAIIGRISDLQGKGVGVQRIYIGANGEKADLENRKMTLGGARGAIMLGDIRCGCLLIAEGLETALSAACLDLSAANLDRKWAIMAATGANTMAKLTPPRGLKLILIAADADQAGVLAAAELRARILTEGIIASKNLEICLPCEKGRDFNDLLMQAN